MADTKRLAVTGLNDIIKELNAAKSLIARLEKRVVVLEVQAKSTAAAATKKPPVKRAASKKAPAKKAKGKKSSVKKPAVSKKSTANTRWLED
ncbi:MAG: hypothetical protein GY862_32440 [Gammaproteobacteria bacterium]|nr:hypothetical protein [Gammaproteobacteria bacterium]